MNSAVKITLIAAVTLLVIGLCMALVGMLLLDFDFSALSTEKSVTNTHEITDTFRNIAIDTDVAAVTLLPSGDGTCRVVCEESEKVKHAVTVRGDTLHIEVMDDRRWFEHIGISFGNRSVTVYLPETAYGVLEAETDTGSIRVDAPFTFDKAMLETDTGHIAWSAAVTTLLTADTDTGGIDVRAAVDGASITLDTATGRVQLTDVVCENLSVESNTGAVLLTNTVASGKLSVETDTGAVTFAGADAGEIRIRTATGSVSGTLLSDKIFFTDTATGRVSVPQTTSGGRCEITTSTGSIDIRIAS